LVLARFIARDNVYIYGSDFDSQVHDELKRQCRCLNRAMTDYFMFGNSMNRDLKDIVYFELLNEHEQDENKIETITKYIETTLQKLMRAKELQDIIVREEAKFSWELLQEK
jgi:hypothetical protein